MMTARRWTWRHLLRRGRRWWAGQSRARRIPMLAGGGGLLCALACCALLLPAALNPRRDTAQVAGTPAPTRIAAQIVTATTRPDDTARPQATATRQAATATPRPPTATREPARTSSPAPTLDPIAGDEQTGQVSRVIDGDTIEVTIGTQPYRVRYIGIDAPEAGATCGADATAANVALVSGQTVRLVRDVSQTDRYDRLLRYVYVDDVFINAELIKRGYAEARRYPPDTAQAAALEAVEEQARAAAMACYAQGVFGGASAAAVATPVTRAETIPVAPVVDTPVPVPTVAPEVPTAAPPTAAPPPANCDPSYPDVCIPPAPPDLDCKDIPYRRFRVLPPDPHNFDGSDNDGIGCESD